MLTEVKAYSAWQSAPQLLLDDNGRAETDLIQVRDIVGLDPVMASIGTVPFGSADGEAFAGTSVRNRNIVLTLHANPDWNVWSFESLRRLLYSYFMPKQSTRLVFLSNDMPTVEINGYVETVAANQFSEDPEFLVSIICPDPYFKSITPVLLSGENGDVIDIEYNGSIEAGFYLKVEHVSGAPTSIQIQDFTVAINPVVTSTKYFEMSSVPLEKLVRNVEGDTPEYIPLFSYVEELSEWPVLLPGDNQFSIITNAGVQNWELQYFERFGGL